jgi:hypothetical protein
VPAPLRGLGITFIITGLMGIGFQSFGGMLTGDNEPPLVEETVVEAAEFEAPITSDELNEPTGLEAEETPDAEETIASIN